MDWIGTLETCDLCGYEYPLSWIIFTGRQFLCFRCYYPSQVDQLLPSRYYK